MASSRLKSIAYGTYIVVFFTLVVIVPLFVTTRTTLTIYFTLAGFAVVGSLYFIARNNFWKNHH